MKKTFLGIAMATMIAVSGFMGATKADSCWGPDCQKSNLDLISVAQSSDFDATVFGNDWAQAGGQGYTIAVTEASANGKTYSGVDGFTSADNRTTAWSSSYDYGKNSYTSAGAYTQGTGYAYGNAYGDYSWKCFPWQLSSSDVTIGGIVSQANAANETGYNDGQYAVAFNTSTAEFEVTRKSSDWDFTNASSQAGFHGGYYYDYWYGYGYGPYAETYGYSDVSIDNTGNERSANAYTWNHSYTSPGYDYYNYYNQGTLTNYDSKVSGNGEVAARSAKSGTFAQGNAGFGYTGENHGHGYAQINTNVADYGTQSSAQSSGYAHSSVSNNNNVPVGSAY